MALEGLRKLEYRGYDSAGLAAIFPDQMRPIETERTTGFVADLVTKANERFAGSHIAIGHTRWATHGRVSDRNAHPHSSNDGSISIVHNGIIENASELLIKAEKNGFSLSSETDSEVIVHLIDHELKNQPPGGSVLEAFASSIEHLEGSWAIAAIVSGFDGILVASSGAPMVIGKGPEKMLISSDIQPLHGLCSEVAYLSDGDIVSLEKNEIKTPKGHAPLKFEELGGEYHEQDPGKFNHMMLKEIHDQVISVTNAISGRISADGISASLGGMSLSPSEIVKLDRSGI